MIITEPLLSPGSLVQMTSQPSTSSSLNCGILGHVDSGKTTLTRRIADMGSTSAFDAHAVTDIRRNTLDLGFSTMEIGGRRLALIDCPGHSRLIRAVLAASTVFDMAIVVIDAISGIQPQTAEHLLLASLFCPHRLILVLNKIDLAAEKNVKVCIFDMFITRSYI
uniref:Tr-type G domain-containing protein n=2 Tax=Caenorhabditis japonica TaxID=281687 RepID=A0A8R1E6M2_CAEJA